MAAMPPQLVDLPSEIKRNILRQLRDKAIVGFTEDHPHQQPRRSRYYVTDCFPTTLLICKDLTEKAEVDLASDIELKLHSSRTSLLDVPFSIQQHCLPYVKQLTCVWGDWCSAIDSAFDISSLSCLKVVSLTYEEGEYPRVDSKPLPIQTSAEAFSFMRGDQDDNVLTAWEDSHRQCWNQSIARGHTGCSHWLHRLLFDNTHSTITIFTTLVWNYSFSIKHHTNQPPLEDEVIFVSMDYGFKAVLTPSQVADFKLRSREIFNRTVESTVCGPLVTDQQMVQLCAGQLEEED